MRAPDAGALIYPLVGEMAGRPEGGETSFFLALAILVPEIARHFG